MRRQSTTQRYNALERRVKSVLQVAQNLYSVNDLADNALVALAAEGARINEAISMTENLRLQLNEHDLTHVEMPIAEGYITNAVMNMENRLVHMVEENIYKAIAVHTPGRDSLRIQRRTRGDAPDFVPMAKQETQNRVAYERQAYVDISK